MDKQLLEYVMKINFLLGILDFFDAEIEFRCDE